MPGFDSITGQRMPIQILRTLLGKESAPHAFLFTGPEGVGKRTTAKAFAMTLNCADRDGGRSALPQACGRCRSCSQIAASVDPDVILIEPQGAHLRIDQIRGLLATLAMKPFHAAFRVVILAQSQMMNTEAGNALLKMLEEPPKGTIMILTAPHRSDLLPTIVSRCRHIRFGPLTHQQLIDLMIKNDAATMTSAAAAAKMADGSYLKAKHFLETPWQARRDWLIHASGLDRPRQMGGRSIRSVLSFSNQLAAHKEEISTLLDILMIWIRDLCVLPHTPELVVNQDRMPALAQAADKADTQKLIHLWYILAKAQKDIAANANLRLTLDAMALEMTTFSAH